MLQIYSSHSKKKEPFKPIHQGKVGIYVCGMTVYDYCHLGHARSMVTFDVITRYLRVRGYAVNYVRNITDIDDKIINRAHENGEDITALTERFIEAMFEDEAALYILRPDKEPRATDNIPSIIELIETLMAKDVAYLAENNDVYYEVAKFDDYGKLSHRDTDESTQAGARIAIGEAKKDPLDFVLWKAAKPGEPQWDSPWGPGRPGWHIECSAMSMNCLGESFDMHGGGFDLLFPHHENELAQSEAATGKPFVNTWIHAGFLQINKEKMSKSLGNFFTIRDVLKEYHPEVVRYFLISSHYRSPLNYSTESLGIARGALERFYIALRDLPAAECPKDTEFEKRFHDSMDDDFNTPLALAVLFDLTREINRIREDQLELAAQYGALLRKMAGVLGILNQAPESYLQGSGDSDSDDEVAKIKGLIAARNQARKDKDFAKADSLRDELTNMGIAIEDGADGTVWRRS